MGKKNKCFGQPNIIPVSILQNQVRPVPGMAHCPCERKCPARPEIIAGRAGGHCRSLLVGQADTDDHDTADDTAGDTWKQQARLFSKGHETTSWLVGL